MKIKIQLDTNNPKDAFALAAMANALEAFEAAHLYGSVPADLDAARGEPKVPPVVTCWTSEGNEDLVKEHLNVADVVEQVTFRDTKTGKTTQRGKPTAADKLKDQLRKKLADAVVGDPIDEMLPIETATIPTVGGVAGQESDLNAVRDELDAIKARQAEREKEQKALTEKSKSAVEPEPPQPSEKALAKAAAKEAGFQIETPNPTKVAEANVAIKTEKVDLEGSIDEALEALDPEPEGELITPEQVERIREFRVEAAKLEVFPAFRAVVMEEYGKPGKFTEIPAAIATVILPRLEKVIATAKEGVATAE